MSGGSRRCWRRPSGTPCRRPDLGFRTQPAGRAGSAEPCRCGSGAAYGDCCKAAGEVPELPAEILWDPLLDQLSEAQLQAAVQSGAVPSRCSPRSRTAGCRWSAPGAPRRCWSRCSPATWRNSTSCSSRHWTCSATPTTRSTTGRRSRPSCCASPTSEEPGAAEVRRLAAPERHVHRRGRLRARPPRRSTQRAAPRAGAPRHRAAWRSRCSPPAIATTTPAPGRCSGSTSCAARATTAAASTSSWTVPARTRSRP
jgi:hypothetical protein